MLSTACIIVPLIHVFHVLKVVLGRSLFTRICLNACLQLLELRLLFVGLLGHVELLDFI